MKYGIIYSIVYFGYWWDAQASTTETLLMPELYKSNFFKVQYLFLTENYNIKGPVVHILKPKWAMG